MENYDISITTGFTSSFTTKIAVAAGLICTLTVLIVLWIAALSYAGAQESKICRIILGGFHCVYMFFFILQIRVLQDGSPQGMLYSSQPFSLPVSYFLCC